MLIIGKDILSNDQDLSTFQELIIFTFDLIGIILLLWIFMKFVDKENFSKLGFQNKNVFKELSIGFLIGIAVVFIGFVFLLFIDQINVTYSAFSLKEIVLSFLLFSVISIAEEVLVRGYILKNLIVSFNKYFALILSSLLFAAMHLANSHISYIAFTNIFLGGILLGLSYIYTKNLWVPIGLHLGWNLFQSLLGFNVSGQDIYSIFDITRDTDNILNGGQFGFEGSILSVILEVVFIIGFIYYNNSKKESLV